MKPVLKIKGKVQDIQRKEKNKPLMKNTINDILNHIDEYINLPQGDKWDDDTVKDADIDFVIERGTKKGQLHIHILFKFKHHTKIQLNYTKIKEAITKRLVLTNIYLYNKLVRNSG